MNSTDHDMGRAQGGGRELSRTTLISYSAFRFADVLVMQTVGTFLRLFYVTTYGIRPGWIALIHPLLKGFDVITDPILGQLSDNTKSKMGRRRPWILWGGIALGISFAAFWGPKYMLFWIRNPEAWHFFVWYIICYLFYYSSHTACVVPYYALGAELTDDYHERTRVTAWRHLIALPAVVLAALTYRLATDPDVFPAGEKAGMAVCTLVVAIIVIALSVITTAGTRERVELQHQPKMPMREALRITFSNRPFLILCGCIFFFQMAYLFVLEFHSFVLIYGVFDGDKASFGRYFFLATIIMVTIAAVANFTARGFARRVGKKIALVIFACSGLLTPLAATFAFDPARPQLYFVFAITIAIGITGMDIIPFSIIADVCDLDELASHRRREGAFMGVYNGIYKAGITVSPIVSNLCLEFCGFDHTLVQQGLPQGDDTIHAIRIALVVVSAALFAGAAACSLALPIRQRDVEAAQEELAKRHAEQG
jgi:GPH family glycoside/pentoside/hexuronide:cation symporter